MAELRRQTVRDALGEGCEGDGVSLRVLDLPRQCYVPCDLPANTLRQQGDALTLWLAPDLALRIGGADSEGFVSDLTDGLAAFELAGPRARDIVAMGCTLDDAALAPGRCARTLFGGVRVILYRHGEAFRLHVERQLAAFLHLWLKTALNAPR